MRLTPTIGFLLGIILSFALAGLARSRPPRKERLIYAVGLVIAALVYVCFGVAGGASAQWLAFESLGVVLYGAAAFGGLRGGLGGRPWLLALGWTAHVAWDVLFHLAGAGVEYTPHWYPWSCVSFDLVVAGAVLASSRRGAVT